MRYDDGTRNRVLALVAGGLSYAEVERQTRVSRRTIGRWWADQQAARAAAIRTAVQQQAAQRVAATASAEFERWRREHLPAISGILDGEPPPRAERRQEADSVRLGTVVSVVLIVGAVLAGVYFLMKGGL